ncbi:MAG: tetraacyldisaccharide 4'-kinase [Candidatus Rokubacteria bacterium]|nr:tetraacyldisaccharide 4'-kinase [Candidatus Rokubacteria bacterium]
MLTATQRARLVRAWREGLPAPWDTLLAGAAFAYRGALALRWAAYASGILRTRSLPCRVLAVGNLTVGGTGKTPLVELVARTLGGRGRRVVIVSRGYGRRRPDRVGLVSDGHRLLLTAREAGDEPYLLARRVPGVPVVVGRDRFRAGAVALPRFQPDVLLLDDGFQQMRLRKDAEVVCLDARAPWGHRGLLPRGSLREPLAALRRAHFLVLTHAAACAEPARLEGELRAYAPTAPIAHAHYEAEAVEDLRSGTLSPADTLRGRPLLAFAGIAVPENFRATLAELGVVPRDFVAFPDHHAYTVADVRALEARAHVAGAETLVTTEKDAVRLAASGTMPVWVLRVRLSLRDEDATWWAALDARLALP